MYTSAGTTYYANKLLLRSPKHFMKWFKAVLGWFTCLPKSQGVMICHTHRTDTILTYISLHTQSFVSNPVNRCGLSQCLLCILISHCLLHAAHLIRARVKNITSNGCRFGFINTSWAVLGFYIPTDFSAYFYINFKFWNNLNG